MIQGSGTERSTFLQKAIEDKELYHPTNGRDKEPVPYQSSILNEKDKTESLSHIKSRGGVPVSCNKKTYHPTKDQNGELVSYQEPKESACW